MGFIQVIEFRLKVQQVHQLGSAYAQQDELRHFRCGIGIIEPVTNRLGNIIIFRKIGTQQKKRCSVKSFRCQVICFHPYGMIVNINLEFNARILQERVLFFNPGYLQTLILVPGLVVIAILPENADKN